MTEQNREEATTRLGWTVVAIHRDEGVGGAPWGARSLKGVARREFDIVAAWSVCRRGRRVQSAGSSWDVPSTVCFVIEI
jgi:hypothetical protein